MMDHIEDSHVPLWLILFCVFMLGFGIGGGLVHAGVLASEIDQVKVDDSGFENTWWGHPVVVITERATGCQYLMASGNGITPRMGTDHQQICLPVRKPQ